MFHRQVIGVTGFEVLVEDSKQLVVENLELPDSIHHTLQWLQWRQAIGLNGIHVVNDMNKFATAIVFTKYFILQSSDSDKTT